MSITLSIGGIPICGAVGQGATITLSVQECWSAYRDVVSTLVEKDLEGNALPFELIDTVPWTINGMVIDRPEAWFLALESID